MSRKRRTTPFGRILLVAAAWCCLWTVSTVFAQTTAFSYQGRLTDSGSPQATYQMQFRLWTAATGGSQIGGQIDNPTVAVTDGVFTVLLDFGASPFTGADRYLEISVRRNAGENYTTLAQRQQIASSPYAIRTLSAQQADVALNANALGGVAANQYVTAASVGNAFIKNDTVAQTANYNITGNAQIGGFVGLATSINGLFRLDSYGPIRAHSDSAAHFVAETIGGTNSWARYYMRTSNALGQPHQSWLMGTSRNYNSDQFYLVDETAGQTRLAISTGGLVGINNTNPQSGLDVRGTGFQIQQRITDNVSNNTLVLQSGTGSNMKITGYNYGSATGVPLYLSTDGANTIINSGGGSVGIGTASPNAKLSVVGNVTQDLNSFGAPKAMLFVNANGTIDRCYNGMTGQSLINGNATSGCGFSVQLTQFGTYFVNLGVPIAYRFFFGNSLGGNSKTIHFHYENATTVLVSAVELQSASAVVSDIFLLVF